MLDINFIRENAQKVREACEKKNVNIDVDRVLALDKGKREFITEMEVLRAFRNKAKEHHTNITLIAVGGARLSLKKDKIEIFPWESIG